jgi:putative Holliday junction resolvase
MGIDYGFKNIGIAMSDVTQTVASPFGVIENLSFKKNALGVLKIAEENDVFVIVLGLPISMNGHFGKMTKIVYKFIEIIKFFTDINVETVDERLTTVQAERMLIDEADLSRKKRKYVKDKIAAALILQIYLDMHMHIRSENLK